MHMPTILCMPHEVKNGGWILMYSVLENIKPAFLSYLILVVAFWRTLSSCWYQLQKYLCWLCVSPGRNINVVFSVGMLFCFANLEKVMDNDMVGVLWRTETKPNCDG